MELQQIGAQHHKVKQALSIIKNAGPNPRRLVVAEGLWAHERLLEVDAPVDTFFWCPEAGYSDEITELAERLAHHARLAFRVSEKTLARLAERERPDGLVSITQIPVWEPDQLVLPDNALVAVADGVEIPGNLGTLIRTLDACGADALILTNRKARLTHPKVFRASKGMILTVPVVDFDDTSEAVEWLRANAFDIYLADTAAAKNYREYDYRDVRTAFVLGSERFGISPVWREAGFPGVFLPMLGQADSLNVSISASVLLFEARAQKSGW
jgi:tRNA G18 (ribose-2'-O)-methylase SpoU